MESTLIGSKHLLIKENRTDVVQSLRETRYNFGTPEETFEVITTFHLMLDGWHYVFYMGQGATLEVVGQREGIITLAKGFANLNAFSGNYSTQSCLVFDSEREDVAGIVLQNRDITHLARNILLEEMYAELVLYVNNNGLQPITGIFNPNVQVRLDNTFATLCSLGGL